MGRSRRGYRWSRSGSRVGSVLSRSAVPGPTSSCRARRYPGLPRPVALGGTRAYLVRAGALRRYFPSATHASAAGKVDLSGQLPWAPAPDGGFPVAVVALVDVDVDPIQPCLTKALDPHTATTVWYRASGHLLDRVLTEGGPLRVLETPPLAEKRLDLVRRVGTAAPVQAMRGTPESIALAIENLPGPAPASRETSGNCGRSGTASQGRWER